MCNEELERLRVKCKIYECALNRLPLSLEIRNNITKETLFRNYWHSSEPLFVDSFPLRINDDETSPDNSSNATTQSTLDDKNCEYSLKIAHWRHNLRMEDVFDILPQMIWMADTQGNCVWFNKYVQEYTNAPKSSEYHFDWQNLISPEDLDKTVSCWLNSMRTGEPYCNEARLKRHDGEYFWFLGRGVPKYDADGNICCWFGTNFDITFSKQMEKEAVRASAERESEKRLFKTILQTLPVEVFCAKAPSGEIVYANPKATTEAIASGVKSIQEYSMYKGAHKDGRIYEIEEYPLARSLAGEVVTNEEITVFLNTGEKCIMRFSSYPIYDERGDSIEYAVAIGVDVTELIDAQKQSLQAEYREQVAREASKMKSAFLANMSHEIRTPLNGVLGMTGFLFELSAGRLTAEQFECLNIIKESGNLLLALINDILDFSKVEAGKLELDLAPFRLVSIPEFVEKLMNLSAKKRNITIEYHKPCGENAELLHVLGDSQRLQQILINLISNAIKFTPEYGKVDVYLDINVGELVDCSIQIKDQGIGMSEATLSRLFTPFSQADSSTTRQYGGTGLGLSICKNLIELMGGYIKAESVEHNGSTFTVIVKFPIASANNNPESHDKIHNSSSTALLLPDQISSPCNGKKKRKPVVLVVEDNLVNSKLIMKILNRRNVETDLATNGQLAVERFKERQYDLILMDCQMPVLDGYGATRQIRHIEEQRNEQVEIQESPKGPSQKKLRRDFRTPIVALTADAVKHDREACLESGMDDYVSKPFTPKDIDEVLGRYVYYSTN